MEMIPVESTAIAEMGYDPDTRTLRLKFQSGGTHEYDDVPAEKFENFLAADSKGKHFQAHIRSQHANRKVA